MRKLAPLGLIVVLAACGGTPAVSTPTDASPSTSAVAASEAAASVSARPSAAEDAAEDDTLFGTFDLDEYNDMFGVDATTATVEGGKIRYVYEIGQVDAEFMVDPNDEAKTIIQSSFAVSDIFAEPTDDENDAMRTWFRITDNRQREAVAWIREKLDEYVAAPGAEMSLREDFGDVTAGFYTIQGFSFDDDADPMRPAEIVGFFVEDRAALGR